MLQGKLNLKFETEGKTAIELKYNGKNYDVFSGSQDVLITNITQRNVVGRVWVVSCELDSQVSGYSTSTIGYLVDRRDNLIIGSSCPEFYLDHDYSSVSFDHDETGCPKCVKWIASPDAGILSVMCELPNGSIITKWSKAALEKFRTRLI